jgi:protein-disulfide isomerase
MKALMTAGTMTLALLLAGCGDGESGGNATAAAGGAPIAAIPAPNGGDWAQVVSETPDGGFLMGNPDAPVKVVEFASMTCGHCASFAEEGIPALTDKYIKTGQVSLELRNFVRDPADLAASLLARCGGATPFFKLTDQIFAAQEEWIGKLQQMTPAQQQQLQSATPGQAVGAMAQQAGLVDFVRLRGIPTEKAQACLADQAALQKLVDMNQKATSTYQIPGTPAFLINGELAQNTADWATLEPKIREALD